MSERWGLSGPYLLKDGKHIGQIFMSGSPGVTALVADANRAEKLEAALRHLVLIAELQFSQGPGVDLSDLIEAKALLAETESQP